MKRIEITHYAKRNNQYEIFLGNGTAHVFSSEVKAKRFLVETNTFLTTRLYQVREVYKDVWRHYQDAWGFFRNYTQKTAKLISLDHDLRDAIRDVENCFDLAVERCSWTNGNFFTFMHLLNACKALRELIKSLQSFDAKKGNTVLVYRYRTLYEQILSVETRIKTYGEVDAVSLFEMPTRKEIETPTQYYPLKIA